MRSISKRKRIVKPPWVMAVNFREFVKLRIAVKNGEISPEEAMTRARLVISVCRKYSLGIYPSLGNSSPRLPLHRAIYSSRV